jgi:hypothetical protein
MGFEDKKMMKNNMGGGGGRLHGLNIKESREKLLM